MLHKLPKIPLAAVKQKQPDKKAKGAIMLGKMNIKNLPIAGLRSERGEPKEEKVHMLFTNTEKSITVKLGSSSFGIRLNGTKYERHSHNVTNATELKYAGIIMGHITAQMKNLSNDMNPFISAIQALNITSKELHKDSVIAVSAIQKWLDEKYPYVEIHTETVGMAELFNMCEGYAKICNELRIKGETSASIRILCNRLFPQKEKETE